MYIFHQYPVGNDFEESARQAVREAYEEDFQAPNEIVVRPGITELSQLVVGVGHPTQFVTVPIRVHEYPDHIGLLEGFFALDCNHGALESCVM